MIILWYNIGRNIRKIGLIVKHPKTYASMFKRV